MNLAPRICHHEWKLHPDPRQVICRPHIPGGGPHRIHAVINRVLALSEEESTQLLASIMLSFSDRHRKLPTILKHHYSLIEEYVPKKVFVSNTRKVLIGAYFTMEYSVASAALFNPSMVPHPDQSGLAPGALRFVMSLRAVGEGHVSSIVFRTGTISFDGSIYIDSPADYVDTPVRQLNPQYDKQRFARKLDEMGAANDVSGYLLDTLPDKFSYHSLQASIEQLFENPLFSIQLQNTTIRDVNWLANSNYQLDFPRNYPISERVLFPTSEDNRGGIEDARFVQFMNDNGDTMYYATYTAYSGTHVLPQLIETPDFSSFRIVTLSGGAIRDKGMALFPRKISGKYVALSRQDGENNHLMFSDQLHLWHESCVIQEPEEPWEFIQIGNCGSPLETPEGWLVLTHGVGPMRVYSIGAMLLDLENPVIVRKRLKVPLLSPSGEEREGYVPNVVYTCGSLLHNNMLILPYAMSDVSSGVASFNLDELLGCMEEIPVP